jgi:hypothetical protein
MYLRRRSTIEAFSWKDLANGGSPNALLPYEIEAQSVHTPSPALGNAHNAGRPPIVVPQSGAIRLVSVASNDSRVTPGFAHLGEMHEVGGGVIFSGARNVPSQAEGEEFCRSLGGGSYLLPIEELELFGRGLGSPNSDDRDQISDQANRFFWSSSVHPNYPRYLPRTLWR